MVCKEKGTGLCARVGQVIEVQEGIGRRHQKRNGGLLCFLEAKGLFFDPLMVGLVLLTPRQVPLV